MPITITDDHGNEVDIEKADGGTLRRKLEEALAANKTLTDKVATSEANRVVGALGDSLIKVEDLVGVPVDQMETKAKELAEAKRVERQETIRTVLAERGLEGAELDAAVEDFLGGQVVKTDSQPSIESLPGTRPSRTPNAPGIDDAMGNLTSFFEDQEKRKK